LDTLAVLIVILLIVLIVRGPKTLPQIGAMLGRGVREARHEAERLRSSDAPDDGTPKPG
jgi:Sec-independent protein translocase protein TatA